MVGTIGQFEFELIENHAKFCPTIPLNSVDAARNALEPLVASWRILSIYCQAGAGMEFKFIAGQAFESLDDERRQLDEIANSLAPPGPPILLAVNVELDSYVPPTLDGVGVNECVLDLADHYLASARAPRSRLLHGYAMLTRVQTEQGNIETAARNLNVSSSWLKSIKRLTSERGVGASARKFTRTRSTLLTNDEDAWLDMALRQLLLRSAYFAAGRVAGEKLTADQRSSIPNRGV
jgi:hypothetical protein